MAASTQTASSQTSPAAHLLHAAGPLPPSVSFLTSPNGSPLMGNLFDGYLALLSDTLDDLEGLRIATENRLRMLTRTETDSDGELRGLGMDLRSPEVATASALLDGIKALEHQAELDLKRQFRKHPLHPFVKAQIGLGEKQSARLLAVLGDPYWNDLHGRPRTVSELWAYAGYAVADGRAQRRQKGSRSNWSGLAKSRAFLIAQSCIKKSNSPYRAVYDEARAQYADAVHPHDCVRCGPSGKPALAGSPLSLGHQHQRALRRVSKTVLQDLWLAARDIHTPQSADGIA